MEKDRGGGLKEKFFFLELLLDVNPNFPTTEDNKWLKMI
jgi:hypothetical protein